MMASSKSLDTSHGTQAAVTNSQPGIHSPIKQETPAIDINVEEEMYVVEVSDDDDSSNEVLNMLRTKEARVNYLMGRIQEVVECAHCSAMPVKCEYTVMEYKMKRQEYESALKKMKCEQAALVEQEMKSGDDAQMKEEMKYQEDVLMEKEIKCEEGAAAKEELE